MAAVDDLIAQVEDDALRKRLLEEVKRLTKERKFGLLYEDHLPELTVVYSAKVKKGCLVAERGKSIDRYWKVLNIRKNKAICYDVQNKKKEEFAISTLVVVRQFGEPIFPSLIPIDRIENGSKGAPWHILIESENYHALQLMGYLYSGKIDCIYIDPPYNTGARDWKYNNNYVDSNDNWRHSKWLAFMGRRLKLAKSLLNPIESVLIVSIDDNELFTIGLLLDEIFPGSERQIINITINPKGKAREGRLSQVDEYLIVLYIGKSVAQEFLNEGSAEEIRWPYLRRSDVESARGTKKGGVRQFYPIYVDKESGKIISIGEALTPEQPLECAPDIDGAIAVFPIREDGKHMNWGLIASSLKIAVDNGYVRVSKSTNVHQPYNFSYITGPSIKKVEEGIYLVNGVREDCTKIVIKPDGKSKKRTTVWSKNLYDANAYGSQMLGSFIKDKKFPFPKSIYAVYDTLKTFIGHKSNGVIVDFFAGSGTTLHAINLMNAEDGGNRRCIIVTNNEVSEDEAKELYKSNCKPGDSNWEKNGICQAITWPRTKYTILGKSNDGSIVEGEYYTSKLREKTISRSFYQLSFTSSELLSSAARKKQLVSMIGKNKVPQSLVTANSKYIISEEISTSILFDDNFIDEWISKLSEQEHIIDFYIVTINDELFKQVKQSISMLLGPIKISESYKIPMYHGFKANVEYFKLDYLDKDQIALGKRFIEILPLLWLKAGAIGPRPTIVDLSENSSMLMSEKHNFAILIDESNFSTFFNLLKEREELEYIYLVTDSDEGFREMASQIIAPNIIQLYRDYLSNFIINT